MSDSLGARCRVYNDERESVRGFGLLGAVHISKYAVAATTIHMHTRPLLILYTLTQDGRWTQRQRTDRT
jgi:hypothetical protein